MSVDFRVFSSNILQSYCDKIRKESLSLSKGILLETDWVCRFVMNANLWIKWVRYALFSEKCVEKSFE